LLEAENRKGYSLSPLTRDERYLLSLYFQNLQISPIRVIRVLFYSLIWHHLSIADMETQL